MQIHFSKKGRSLIPTLGRALKNHYQFILFVLLILVIGGWSILFFEYGWKTAYEQPEITVRSVKIRSDDLISILADIEKRKEVNEQILLRTFPNPFIAPPKEP